MDLDYHDEFFAVQLHVFTIALDASSRLVASLSSPLTELRRPIFIFL